MGRLADADGEAAARLVLRYFPGDHAAVLAGFAAAPERQFRFLRGALQARTLCPSPPGLKGCTLGRELPACSCAPLGEGGPACVLGSRDLTGSRGRQGAVCQSLLPMALSVAGWLSGLGHRARRQGRLARGGALAWPAIPCIGYSPVDSKSQSHCKCITCGVSTIPS